MNVMLAVMTVSPVFQSAFSFQLNNVFFAKCSSLKCPRIIKQNTLLSMLKENQYSNIKAKEQECGDPPKLVSAMILQPVIKIFILSILFS